MSSNREQGEHHDEPTGVSFEHPEPKYSMPKTDYLRTTATPFQNYLVAPLPEDATSLLTAGRSRNSTEFVRTRFQEILVV